jgi:hypothetical protein
MSIHKNVPVCSARVASVRTRVKHSSRPEIQPEVRQLDRDVRRQALRADLIEQLEIVITHGVGFFSIRHALAERGDHGAHALTRELAGRAQRGPDIFAGHELAHRAAARTSADGIGQPTRRCATRAATSIG